ncbi:MAG: hypothetical protein ABIW80_04350 [Lapillicoccus sp.]
MTAIDEVWDVLNDALIQLYGEVLRNTGTVTWHANAQATPYYLLSGYAYFPRKHRPDTEALVVSVHVGIAHGVIDWTSDACMDSGPMLTVGPSRTEPDTTPLASWVGDALSDTITWLKAETPNFIAYLNQEPTPYDLG